MVCETPHLIIRKLELNDAPFIVQLLNTPGWLEYIGDRGVKNITDAEQYLKNGPLHSYSRNGFGLWAVQLKSNGELIGMSGLLKRDTLEHPDIGFAFLPAYYGKGYGKECVRAILSLASTAFSIKTLNAITTPSNAASQRLLTGSGFIFERVITSGNEELNLYRKDLHEQDK